MFDEKQWEDAEARARYLEDRKLKTQHSNTKGIVHQDGHYIYRQKNEACGGLDKTKKTVVEVDPGVYMCGVYKYCKFKFERINKPKPES
jgi:hypothetical protein